METRNESLTSSHCVLSFRTDVNSSLKEVTVLSKKIAFWPNNFTNFLVYKHLVKIKQHEVTGNLILFLNTFIF